MASFVLDTRTCMTMNEHLKWLGVGWSDDNSHLQSHVPDRIG